MAALLLMYPKPETESEQIKRMLEFWFGGSSPAGRGKANAGASASIASSSESMKELETITPGRIATALAGVLRAAGTPSADQHKPDSTRPSAPAKNS